jgi:predicted ATP-grasp superfamily ATP-dependent carboligase
MKRVLVTGAGGPAGVNFIRSLRASDEAYYIVGTDIDRYHLEWPDVDVAYEAPRSNDPGYVDFLNDVIERESVELLHPQPDGEVRVISENRDNLKARTFLPSRESIRICQDKHESARVWAEKGVQRTESILIESREDLERAAEQLGLPFWLRATEGAGGLGSTPVDQVDVGWHWIQYWRMRGKEWQFVAHELLGGRNLAFTSLWHEGRIVCSQVRERLEYIYPYLAPSGVTGTPVLAVTRKRPDVDDIATRAVQAIDPQASGVWSVDLKEDSEGIPRPTEVNCGRFFTTSYFFTAAGVNIPDLYVRLGFGEELPELQPYSLLDDGIYWIRHIDCPAVLRTDADLRAIPLDRR